MKKNIKIEQASKNLFSQIIADKNKFFSIMENSKSIDEANKKMKVYHEKRNRVSKAV